MRHRRDTPPADFSASSWTEEGGSPEEIVGEFPQRSPADVFAALAFYHDHREQIDAEIAADEEFARKLREDRTDGSSQ